MTNPVLTNTAFSLTVDVSGAAAAGAFAGEAQASALAAATSATAAAGSATTATTEAGVATTQAGNAAASATAASGSAATSTTNANNVAALLASFRGVFLGAFASDSAAQAFATANSITLSAGLMYENTTEDKFRIYSGSAWGDYDATAQASQTAAALSATNAGASATAAANSAASSLSSATNAATSASAAASSSSAATASASAAASSATSASGSAVAAAASASAAAVGNPNLLFNSSAEFGTDGWTMAAGLSAQTDTVAGVGTHFVNSGALSAVTQTQTSQNIPAGAAQALNFSASINTAGVSAGTVTATLVAYNASNALLGAVATLSPANDETLSSYTGSGTTPANTTYVQVSLNLSGVTASAGGLSFQRMKVERGTSPSLYSTEADLIVVEDLANGAATNAGTLTGAETVPVSRGAGLLQTTLNTIATFVRTVTLLAANNLSDVANAATARGNLTAAKSGANSDITSLTGLTTALSIAQGGTGGTSQATALTALGAASSGANSSITSLSGLTTALSIAQGGTGAISQSAALTALGAAASGANSNITSLSGLTTPLSAAQGGTGGAPLSGRNRVINGACNVAQRASAAFTSGSGYAGPDRYYTANSGGAGGQFTQGQGTITYNGVAYNAVVQTVNTALTTLASGSYWLGIQHKVEGFNCHDLLGQKVSLSFLFETNVSGTYSVCLQDGPSSNSYVTTFAAVANTPLVVTVQGVSLATGLSIPNSNAVGFNVYVGALNNGSYNTATLNAWQSGSVISASGATNWGAAANNYIALTLLQLEAGPVATPFEFRPYSVELALCQRYLPAIVSGGGDIAGGFATSTSAGIASYAFKVTPRVAPTGITVTGVGDFSVATQAASSVTTAVSFANAGLDAARLTVTGTGTPYTANSPLVFFGNSAGGTILFNGCEL